MGAVSLIPMGTQLGYAVGLFFLIPLGDYIERQRLILRQAQVLSGTDRHDVIANGDSVGVLLLPYRDGCNSSPTDSAACRLALQNFCTR